MNSSVLKVVGVRRADRLSSSQHRRLAGPAYGRRSRLSDRPAPSNAVTVSAHVSGIHVSGTHVSNTYVSGVSEMTLLFPLVAALFALVAAVLSIVTLMMLVMALALAAIAGVPVASASIRPWMARRHRPAALRRISWRGASVRP